MTKAEKEQKYDTALEMKSQGETITNIAEFLGMNRSTVTNWIHRSKGKQFLKGGRTVSQVLKDSEFIEAVKSSFSISQTLETMGLKAAGANYKGFHQRVKRLNLDTSHFTGQGHLRGKTHKWAPEISLEEAFVKGGSLSSFALRKKILKYDLKPYLCDICGINSWLEKVISLHIDHINGDSEDNRLENLRFLCPNCHSQTDTYCGKSKGKNKLS